MGIDVAHEVSEWVEARFTAFRAQRDKKDDGPGSNQVVEREKGKKESRDSLDPPLYLPFLHMSLGDPSVTILEQTIWVGMMLQAQSRAKDSKEKP